MSQETNIGSMLVALTYWYWLKFNNELITSEIHPICLAYMYEWSGSRYTWAELVNYIDFVSGMLSDNAMRYSELFVNGSDNLTYLAVLLDSAVSDSHRRRIRAAVLDTRSECAIENVAKVFPGLYAQLALLSAEMYSCSDEEYYTAARKIRRVNVS